MPGCEAAACSDLSPVPAWDMTGKQGSQTVPLRHGETGRRVNDMAKGNPARRQQQSRRMRKNQYNFHGYPSLVAPADLDETVHEINALVDEQIAAANVILEHCGIPAALFMMQRAA